MAQTHEETQGNIVSIAAFRVTRPWARPMPLFDDADHLDRLDRQQSAARPMPTARSIEHRKRMLGFLEKRPASATLTR